MVLTRQILSIFVSCALAVPVFAQGTSQTMATTSSAPSASEFQQLVAPIALYPDALVGQVLAASTYPTQVVEADRWLQQNPGLKGEALGSAVDKQPWDPSIKGLTQFPDVLNNMSKNITWTSALGDAYFNDPQSVMNAIQALRKDAEKAGNLTSSSQQTVKMEGQTIIIEPADPTVVYVPSYSPAVVYGTTIAPYPGYSGWDVAAASALSFGVGTLVGAAAGGWGWGWGHWGANWHGGNVSFNRNAYVSRSNAFVNRNSSFNQFNRANVNRNAINRDAATRNAVNQGIRNKPAAGTLNRPSGVQNFDRGAGQFNRERQSAAMSRGFSGGDRSSIGSRSGGFSDFRQGGSARFDSARGRSSFGGGGGGGFRGGGGGGFRGGGGGRGGGRR